MYRDTLIQAGNFLYGPQWRSKLAARLCVERSTVTRWASGAVEPPGLARVAVELLVERKRITDELSQQKLVESSGLQ